MISNRVLVAAVLLACFVGSAWCQSAVASGGAAQVKLSEILISLGPSASPEELASAEREARSIIDGLNAGVPFEQEAREHSKGPTAAQGGNIGYFARGKLGATLEEQVFNLQIGAITNPIRTKQGLVIIKVTDRTYGPTNNYQGDLDVLSDTEGVDFGPYLSSALQTIRKQWYENMPDEARAPIYQQGNVVVTFSIRKRGTVEGVKVTTSSSDPILDQAAWNAIAASSPLPALPSQYSKDFLNLRIRFFYNPDRKVAAPVDKRMEKTHSPEPL